MVLASRPVTDALHLRDITLPRTDTRTVRDLINRHARDLLQRLVTIPIGLLRPDLAPLHQGATRIYRDLLSRDPRPLVRVLRQPTHSALLITLGRQMAPDGDRDALNRWVAELHLETLFELAVLRALPNSLEVQRRALPDATWPVLRSPIARVEIALDDEVNALRFTNDGIHVRVADEWSPLTLDGPEGSIVGGSLRRPYHVIDDGILLAVTDNNPLSQFEAHPDKSGNAIDLGGRSADEWVDVLRQSLELIDTHLPLVGQEMRLLLRLIVPVGWHDQKHLSASYQEAVGTIYLTLHPNLMTMTEALVHEFQHNKINAAFTLDPLLSNGFSPLYTSPVRPDPRPLHGVILAVHAFQPVAKLYENMLAAKHPMSRNPQWKERFRAIVAMNEAGSETVLGNSQPTQAGAGLFEEMRELDSYFRSYAARTWPNAEAAEVLDL